MGGWRYSTMPGDSWHMPPVLPAVPTVYSECVKWKAWNVFANYLKNRAKVFRLEETRHGFIRRWEMASTANATQEKKEKLMYHFWSRKKEKNRDSRSRWVLRGEIGGKPGKEREKRRRVEEESRDGLWCINFTSWSVMVKKEDGRWDDRRM